MIKAVPLILLCALLPGCRTNESPEEQVNDLEITTSIKSKLASDVGLSSVPNISVNSTNGVVTLSGQVSSADDKAKAETIAKSVPKVVKVVNNLQVASKPAARNARGNTLVLSSAFRRTSKSPSAGWRATAPKRRTAP